MKKIQRRTFLEFLLTGAASAVLLPSSVLTESCALPGKIRSLKLPALSLPPSAADQLELSPGFRYDVLVKWGDAISATDSFGFNNDYLAYVPLNKKNTADGLLWVNHEYPDAMFVSGFIKGEAAKTKEQVEKEMYAVGGSILRVQQSGAHWSVIKNDPYNRRLTANTKIPFNWPEPIAGSTSGLGTLANCAGGITPWDTILTCEENYQNYWGDRLHGETDAKPDAREDYGWMKHFNRPPEHYGWVVEVNPRTGEAQKHIALGRCAHECATVKELSDGRLAVYTGDDANDQCLYKFVSDRPGSLLDGTLYVADTVNGRWISLKYEDQSVLQSHFKNQTEVLIYLRKAADLVGGTKLDRPEDIEIDPLNGNVLVTLTNNIPKGNYVGSILKITEHEGRHDAVTFAAETYLTGGPDTGFASPDNMAFDAAGNLWFTSDMSGTAMNNTTDKKYAVYLPFKNNSLFVMPREGAQKGKIIRVANAPVNAEFTGPVFAPDGTLLLSVQHPGEYSPSAKKPLSNWPDGNEAMPRPAVVAIRYELA